jgi:hypothetical protein
MYNPVLTRIRCYHDQVFIRDVGAAVAAELAAAYGIFDRLPSGARIAVAVGSRGIANLALIVRELVAGLRARGLVPFIVPAMGSHGGACSAGQLAILEDYGVTEVAVGAPVVSSMETVELAPTAAGTRVFMARAAWESDGVVLVNRIKAHSDFHGQFESGLMKMAVIGLGKHEQALEIHSHGVFGLRGLIGPVAQSILATGKILGGLAIVENAADQTAHLQLLPAAAIPTVEQQLLQWSKSLMPRLPLDPLDVLVVDEIGKNISGVGMDPNIIGRMRVPGQAEPDYPRIATIVVCDLTAESHGNALGLGLADVTTRAVFDKIDYMATMANAVTSTFLERAKIPLMADNPCHAVGIALRAAAVRDPAGARLVRIRNTLRLDELHVSDALLPELAGRDGIEITAERAPLFDGVALRACFKAAPA